MHKINFYLVLIFTAFTLSLVSSTCFQNDEKIDRSLVNPQIAAGGDFLFGWGSKGTADGQFTWPAGITIDKSGNIYVADDSNSRVQVFNATGGFLRKWGSHGLYNGQFQRPISVAVNSTGYVFVTELWNHRVQVFSNSGVYERKWGAEGDGDGQFQEAYGIAIDTDDNVYVVDSWNHRVQVFTSTGTFLRKWGGNGTGDGQFQFPRGIAIDSDNNIYVADTYNSRIQVFNSMGVFLSKWGSSGDENGKFRTPSCLATDPLGNIYVGDSGNSRIQVFAPNGTYLYKWWSNSSTAGIAIGSELRVYVTDLAKCCIKVFSGDLTSCVPDDPTFLPLIILITIAIIVVGSFALVLRVRRMQLHPPQQDYQIELGKKIPRESENAPRAVVPAIWKTRLYLMLVAFGLLFLVPSYYEETFSGYPKFHFNGIFFSISLNSTGISETNFTWQGLITTIPLLVCPLILGCVANLKIRKELQVGKGHISPKWKSYAQLSAILLLFYVLTIYFNRIEAAYYGYLSEVEIYPSYSYYLKNYLPLPTMLVLPFLACLFYFTFDLPHFRALDFHEKSVVFSSIGGSERQAAKLWKKRLVCFIVLFPLILSSASLDLAIRILSQPRNYWFPFITSIWFPFVTSVIWVFLPIGLGITSSLLTATNLHKQGDKLSRGTILLARISVIIPVFFVLRNFHGNFTFLSSIAFYPDSDMWAFYLYMFFIGNIGNYILIPLLLYLTSITFSFPKSRAYDFLYWRKSKWKTEEQLNINNVIETNGKVPIVTIHELQDTTNRTIETPPSLAYERWHLLAENYEAGLKFGEALYCWDQAAALGDPSGKLRGDQLRTQHIHPILPKGLPEL